jgi:prophage regulatory protein
MNKKLVAPATGATTSNKNNIINYSLATLNVQHQGLIRSLNTPDKDLANSLSSQGIQENLATCLKNNVINVKDTTGKNNITNYRTIYKKSVFTKLFKKNLFCSQTSPKTHVFIPPVSTQNSGDNMNTTRLIRRPQVEQLTGLSRSCIYARMSRNEFPKAISIGGRLVAWDEEEIQQWISERIQESKQNNEAA